MKYLKRPIQAGSRAGIIGCSDIGTIFGVNPWATELDLYRRFFGEEEVLDEKKAKRFWLGHKAEEGLVAPYVEEDLGVVLYQQVDKNGVELAWYREDMPYFLCHPDRLIQGPFKDVERVGVEIKTVAANSKGWGEEWTDDVPAQYLLQCAGYVACGVCDAVLLVAFRDMAIYYYWIKPAVELVDAVLVAVSEWYKNAIQPDFRPTPSNYKEALELHSDKAGLSLTADEAILLLVKEMRDTQAQLKELEGRVDEIKTLLIKKMDGYKTLVDQNGDKLCSIVVQSRRNFNKEAALKAHPDLAEDEFYKITQTKTLR